MGWPATNLDCGVESSLGALNRHHMHLKESVDWAAPYSQNLTRAPMSDSWAVAADEETGVGQVGWQLETMIQAQVAAALKSRYPEAPRNL